MIRAARVVAAVILIGGLFGLAVSAPGQSPLGEVAKEELSEQAGISPDLLATMVVTDGPEFTLSLADDGRGWDEGSPPPSRGRGLRNMELRARRIDGTIRIASRPGSGSTIALTRRARPTTTTG